MNPYRKITHAILLVASLGTMAAGPALAAPACDHEGDHQGWHARKWEQHHKRLHDALKLTAEQEPAWQKLLESEQPGAGHERREQEDWNKLSAPERAEKRLELSKARQARATEHLAVLKSFYATLTPQQQTIFDDFHRGHQRRPVERPEEKTSAPAKP